MATKIEGWPAELTELERAERAGRILLDEPRDRVEYCRDGGPGPAGVLEELGVGTDGRGPIFSRVRFDGRDFGQLVKTEYLKPSDSVAPSGPPAEVDPLAELLASLPPEDLTGADKLPQLARVEAVANVHIAIELRRIGDILMSLAEHFGVKP